MDIYARVTDKIINLLENGVVPWRRPWTSTGLPRNLVSKKPYRGLNFFLLSASKYVSPFWLTIRQANELGGHVRKGEESTLIVYWKVDDVKQSREDLDARETDEKKTRRRFLLRYYRIWSNANFRKPCSTRCRRSKRTNTIRSKRANGLSPECRTRPRFSIQVRRLTIVRSRIASPFRRASYLRAPRNISRRWPMRRPTRLVPQSASTANRSRKRRR
jgi:hypothetical protein